MTTNISTPVFAKCPRITGFLEILLLTVGILAGSFTLTRIFHFPEWFPSVLLDIRTLCLVAFAGVYSYRRYAGFENVAHGTGKGHWSGISLIALGVLFLYMLAGNVMIWEKPAGASAFYPLGFAILYSFAILMCVDRIEKIYLMAKISLGIIAAIFIATFIHGGFSKNSLSMLQIGSPYFFSRGALIGFTFSLFLFRREFLIHKSHAKAFGYAALAALFIFAGLLTFQRSTVLFYAAVSFIILMVLAARRDYKTAGVMLATLISGYLLSVVSVGDALVARTVYHSPLHVSMKQRPDKVVLPTDTHAKFESEDKIGNGIVHCENGRTLANNALCGFDDKKIAECMEYLKAIPSLDAKVKAGITVETCRSGVLVNDSDARLRMMSLALTDTPSRLFGKGLDSFYFVQFDPRELRTYVYYYPHSIFFGIYHDTGLIGFAFLMLAVVAMLILSLRIIVLGPSSAIILLIIPLYYLLSSFVSGDIYDARFLWFVPIMIRNCILPSLETLDRQASL